MPEHAIEDLLWDAAVLCDTTTNEAMDAQWSNVVEHKLNEWRSDPARFADDGVAPPSMVAIQLAAEWAAHCRKNQLPPPDSVVLDPNGGIVFERRGQGLAKVMHFRRDGTTEYREFQGNKLVLRQMV